MRLDLPVDGRVLVFLTALSAAATILFGLLPALQASSTKPAAALRGGENPHSRRSLMYGIIGAQVAFCFVVHLAADAFVTTWQRLTHQSTGFSADRVLTLETVTETSTPVEFWFQAADHLRETPGVDNVALADVPLLGGSTSNGFVATFGNLPSPMLALFLNVSPAWLETMRIPLLEGRDLRRNDAAPGSALVNLAFAKEYFGGEDPVGKTFLMGKQMYRVVGLVANAQYRSVREPAAPIAYIPLPSNPAAPLNRATFLVRTRSPNPYILAPSCAERCPERVPNCA